MTKPQDDLVTDNIRLVYFLIHKYYPTYVGDDDIVQCGMLGLVKAVKNYNENIGTFSTYASVIIRREIGKEIKSRENDKLNVSLEGWYENNGQIV